LANEDFKSARSGGFAHINEEIEQLGINTEDGLFGQYEDALEAEKSGALGLTYSELLENIYGGAIKSEEEYLKFEKDFINKMKENYGDLIEDEKDYREFLSDMTPYSDIVAAKEELLTGRTGDDAEFMQKLIDEFGVESVAILDTIPKLDEAKY
jgi:hypothetical protein